MAISTFETLPDLYFPLNKRPKVLDSPLAARKIRVLLSISQTFWGASQH
jgi:hypothetical protein